MLKLNNKKLRSLIFEEFGNLILEKGEEDEAAEKGAKEAGGEQPAGDELEDLPEETPEEMPEEEPEEEKIDLEPDDVFAVGKEIDAALEKVLADYETRALKSAAIDAEIRGVHESFTLLDILKEEGDPTGPEIDVGQFVSDVARLIKNYEHLLDLEAIIFNKGQDYLLDKYGEQAAMDYVDLMRDQYDLDFSNLPQERERHYAVTGAPGGSDVGYGTGGGGGAAGGE